MTRYRNMKKLIFSAWALALLAACAPDNMEAPNCHVTGRMCYQGQPIGVRGSGSASLTETTTIELWQAGFGKETPQKVNIMQDGTFSTYIYPGDIRLITRQGVGPWQQADTLRVSVKGDVQIDYEVTPYFLITDAVYDYDPQSKKLTATANVLRGVEGARISSMGLLVNDRQFVDMANQKASVTANGEPGTVTFTLDLANLSDCHALYARLFVKSDMAGDAAYSTTPFHVW